MPEKFQSIGLSLEQVLHGAADGVFIIDEERRFIYFSDRCSTLTGYPAEEVLGTTCKCADVTNCHDDYGRPLWGALCPAKQILDGSAPTALQRMRIRRRDGSLLWVETSYAALRNGGGGGIAGIVGIMRDVSDSKQRDVELHEEMGALAAELDRARAEKYAEASSASAPTDGVALNLDDAMQRIERDVIIRSLRAAGGHRNQAARLLGISRSRLYRRMEALRIDPNEVS